MGDSMLGAAGVAPTTMDQHNLAGIGNDIQAELNRAAKYPPFNSAHEGYGVLLEEMDELKEHVWTRQKLRDLAKMRAEAVQVAAMSVKFIQMIDMGRGRV